MQKITTVLLPLGALVFSLVFVVVVASSVTVSVSVVRLATAPASV
jgi:hypothetical protein